MLTQNRQKISLAALAASLMAMAAAMPARARSRLERLSLARQNAGLS
jgi:hypothetical protein